MMFLSCAVTLAILGAVRAQPAPPHLAQAWIAESSGDGLPGETGKEYYLWEDCPHGRTSEDCIQAHIFDYGDNVCVKLEINAGFGSNATGTYQLWCDGGLDCCYEGNEAGEPPDVKQWDIYHSDGRFDPLRPKVTYLGKRDTTELNNKPIAGADVWSEKDPLPFTHGKEGVNYTYYITPNGTDWVSHRIDFAGPGADGSILYGDFQIQPTAKLDEFRKYFLNRVPAVCLHPNVLACQ
jgi:hypothetical protein